MVDYIVPSGVISDTKVKLLINEINNLGDLNIVQKLDKLGISLDDYLALCEEERFRHQIVANAFYMFVIPNTARFLHRHMVAAMKGGRGSARVVLKLWASFNRFLEAAAYDKRGGDNIYLDLRQMSQEQLEQELGFYQKKLVDIQAQVRDTPPSLPLIPVPIVRRRRGRPPRAVGNDKLKKSGCDDRKSAESPQAPGGNGTPEEGKQA